MEVKAPFSFEAQYAGERHAHYGRFLRLEPRRLVELTWVTAAGTKGAETVVTMELKASETSTQLRLTDAGRADEESCDRQKDAWPEVLAHLDDVLARSG